MIKDAHPTKKKAKEIFEAWAHRYDRSLLNYFLFRPSCYVMLEELAKWQETVGRPWDILDIGCGTGTLVSMIADSNLRNRHLVGLDYAMEMCQQSQNKTSMRQHASRVRFINADSEHLPFADGSFDILCCANSFHHYPHQQVVVNEMRRVIRSGGRLMIIDGFRDNVIGWAVFDVVITAIEKSVYHAPWTVMRAYFEEAGFQDVRHRKFNFLFPAFATIGTVP